VLAAIQGAAVGGSLGLALACDFRIATPDARFAANSTQLGLHQGFGISVTLPAVVGQQHALDLLYTGGGCRAPRRWHSASLIGWSSRRTC
jgi:enoyl-CoA hydratase/carnithine racemase